jgi:hypothetical protein
MSRFNRVFRRDRINFDAENGAAIAMQARRPAHCENLQTSLSASRGSASKLSK